MDTQIIIRPTSSEDTLWMRSFMEEHWGAEVMIAHGTALYPAHLPGFVAELNGEIVGLATYRVEEDECELVSLDSMETGMGIGTALIEAVRWAAMEVGCTRLWLITTNDNLDALGFYQKRGFQLAAIYPGAVDRARMVKPSIPLAGDNGIPIRDEIELEMSLDGSGSFDRPVLQ